MSTHPALFWVMLTTGFLHVVAFQGELPSTHHHRNPNGGRLNGVGQGGQMNEYIDKYLGKQQKKEIVLAIPCDSCHELQIELESVQRAILYHCPIAVHACLPGSTLKLPMLSISCDSSSLLKIEDAVKGFVDRFDADGLRVQFEKLEIEGGEISENEILYTAVNREDKKTLRNLAGKLKETIQLQTGFECTVPDQFRVPFMKLPPDWNNYLQLSQNTTEEILLWSDEGGNGVSPLYWIQWCDDKFGGPQRLREIGLFEASAGFPFALLPFPGCESMTATELHWEEYQEERMQQAEDALKRELEGGEYDLAGEDLSTDPLFLKTRERLEQVYREEIPIASQLPAEQEREVEWSDIQDDLTASPQRDSDPDTVDEWTRKRIQQIIEAKKKRTRPDLQPKKRRALPPIEENEVLLKLRRGEFSEKQETPEKEEFLTPFPSREHCIGIWEMISSPTGFEVEVGDPTKSDNLILRVDGTTAGGPILDQETRQKACGGKWRSKDYDLYIELVIPPEKDRVLVLKGSTEQPFKPSIPMTRNTFGVPELEERFKVARSGEDEIYCRGRVWLEDAGTKLNRSEVGSFAMKKLERPKNGYIINIPRNIRPQD